MRNGPRFFLATGIWAAALVVIAAAHQVATAAPGGGWHVTNLGYQTLAWFGLVLTFAAFAGGLSISRVSSIWSAGKLAVPITVIAYVLLAYAAPIARYRVQSSRGVDVSTRDPFGPATPSALRALRDQVEADPPLEFNYRFDRPFELPPSWLTYLLHSVAAMSIFAILAAVMGHLAGCLTSGLSPPARRNARWAMGLLSAVAFFLAVMVGDDWVRSDPLHSGILGAWVPLLLPLAELAILARLTQMRRRRLHASAPPSV